MRLVVRWRCCTRRARRWICGLEMLQRLAGRSAGRGELQLTDLTADLVRYLEETDSQPDAWNRSPNAGLS